MINDIKLLCRSHGWVFTFVVFIFFSTLLTSLMPFGIYVWIILSTLLLLLIPWYHFFDLTAFCVILFSLSYGFFASFLDVSYSNAFFLSNFLIPLPLYTLGKWFVYRLNGNDRQLILLICLSILCITFVLIYRTLLDVRQNGIVSSTRTFDIEGVDAFAATIYGLYAGLLMVGFPMFIFCIKKQFIRSFFYLMLAIFGLLATVHLVNRTGLVIAFSTTILGLFYTKRNRIGMIVVQLLLLFLFFYFLIELDIIPKEIIDAYVLRTEYSEDSGESLAGGRGNRWLDAIVRMFNMPFGWYHSSSISGYSFVHNLWLDIARVVGIIPLFLFLVPTIIAIKNCISLFLTENKEINLLILSLNLAILLACFVEPVIEASIVYAYFYMFVWGITSQVVKQERMNLVRCVD